MDKEKGKNWLNPRMNRRTFIKVSGVLASAAMAVPVFKKSEAVAAPAVATGENLPDGIETADNIIYSVCQMCHSRCGVRSAKAELATRLLVEPEAAKILVSAGPSGPRARSFPSWWSRRGRSE